MNKPKLSISFSGGETSAYMTQRILGDKKFLSQYSDVSVVFANTGEEHEETLKFVQRCSEYFGFHVNWVEAVIHPENGKGTTHKDVDFDSASRNGEPFEQLIKVYGIPNMVFQSCTRELKTNAMNSWRKANGFHKNSSAAIGIRADEYGRIAKSSAKRFSLTYPLYDWGITKAHVNCFWDEQPFRLNLKGYEGNCKTCWKKSHRKLCTIALENPQHFDNFRRWEKMYENHIPPTQVNRKGPIRFFRGNMTVQDIFDKAGEFSFNPARDDKHDFAIQSDFHWFLNADYSSETKEQVEAADFCSESCEAF